MFSHFCLVYFRHFLNHTVVFLLLFRRPLQPSSLGSHLVRLMLAPALGPGTTF